MVLCKNPLHLITDCWMLPNRTAGGNQIANPEKFPDGFQAATAYIHSLGLKSGLYTAKGPRTCAGFAASCEHEAIDAAQWASWGIDYVKVRECSLFDVRPGGVSPASAIAGHYAALHAPFSTLSCSRRTIPAAPAQTTPMTRSTT